MPATTPGTSLSPSAPLHWQWGGTVAAGQGVRVDAVLSWLEDWVDHVDWFAFVSIPIFTGVIGYLINWSGLWMLFKPIRFRGVTVPGMRELGSVLQSVWGGGLSHNAATLAVFAVSPRGAELAARIRRQLDAEAVGGGRERFGEATGVDLFDRGGAQVGRSNPRDLGAQLFDVLDQVPGRVRLEARIGRGLAAAPLVEHQDLIFVRVELASVGGRGCAARSAMTWGRRWATRAASAGCSRLTRCMPPQDSSWARAWGRGPIRDISPRTTFSTWGSSSRLRRRSTPPRRVTRASPRLAQGVEVTCSALERARSRLSSAPQAQSQNAAH